MCHEYEDASGIRTLFSLTASSACKEKATLHGYDSWELFEYSHFWTFWRGCEWENLVANMYVYL